MMTAMRRRNLTFRGNYPCKITRSRRQPIAVADCRVSENNGALQRHSHRLHCEHRRRDAPPSRGCDHGNLAGAEAIKLFSPKFTVIATRRLRSGGSFVYGPVRRTLQVAFTSVLRPPRNKSSFRRLRTARACPCCPSCNIERDVEPPSRRFAEAAAIRRAQGERRHRGLRSRLPLDHNGHAASRASLLQLGARRWPWKQAAQVVRTCAAKPPAQEKGCARGGSFSRHFNVQRETTANTETSLLDSPPSGICGAAGGPHPANWSPRATGPLYLRNQKGKSNTTTTSRSQMA